MTTRDIENFEYCNRIAQELEEYYNGEITNEDGEQLSLYDYFSDVLDYEYTINSQLEYKAIKLYVTLGGPTVWIDTNTNSIELRWANEKASYYLKSEIADEIDSIWEEFYNCSR